jgi:hypothetical protein
MTARAKTRTRQESGCRPAKSCSLGKPSNGVTFMQAGLIRLISHANGIKPQTIVFGECAVYERLQGERVHVRDDTGKRCHNCGAFIGPWFESQDRWSAHKDHC